MMNDDWKDLLASWEVPDPDPELKKKVVDLYREQFHGSRSSVWKRLITARLPIPVPVAAAAILLFTAMSYFALRAHQPGSFGQAVVDSATDQSKSSENPSARGPGNVRASLPDAYGPSKATTSSSEGKQAKAVGSQSTKPPQQTLTITLQGEQETIQCVLGTEYRPIAVPRIYAGIVFNPSEMR